MYYFLKILIFSTHLFAKGPTIGTPEAFNIELMTDGNDEHSEKFAFNQGYLFGQFSETHYEGHHAGLPDHLYKAEIGSTYAHPFDGDRQGTLSFSVTNSSDQLLHHHEDLEYKLIGAYHPQAISDHETMTYLFFMSNHNSLINYFPMPGLVYTNKKEKWNFVIGIPFTRISYTSDHVRYAFQWFLSQSSLDMQTTQYRVNLFIAFKQKADSFLPTNRSDPQNHLIVESKSLSFGARMVLKPIWIIEAELGRGFDRMLSYRKTIFDDKETFLHLEKNTFLKLGMKLPF